MGILDSVLALTVGGSDGSPSKLQRAIAEVVPPGVSPRYVLATGHSLGGGVAQLGTPGRQRVLCHQPRNFVNPALCVI